MKRIYHTIPLYVSIVFFLLSLMSKKLIEMGINTDAIPLYSFSMYINMIFVFTIPFFIYIFLAFGIYFTTIVTSTDHVFHIRMITKWLSIAFIFPLLTESFYAINFYVNFSRILTDNDSISNIVRIGAFSTAQFNLINYFGWLGVLLFMFIVQYLKFEISFLKSLINTFMFIVYFGIFYVVFDLFS